MTSDNNATTLTSANDTLNLQFRDLKYVVRNSNIRFSCLNCVNWKQRRGREVIVQDEAELGLNAIKVESDEQVILAGVSGEFHAGQLAAVLGPSGAGKTTLLSILAGFRKSGVSGEILLNGVAREEALKYGGGRRVSCLIPQETAMLDTLTVAETFVVAARLKLGQISKTQLIDKVRETSCLLGLESCLQTTVGNLSGGEKKRLSCGVELLSNPPLMFFDEPTSGLDACSAYQVLMHLRELAHRDRRNIVCSIHQPGSRLFQAFDSVLVMAPGGRCLLRGPREELVPLLQQKGFYCPPFYNPADYVLEVATGERGDIEPLVSHFRNPPVQTTITNINGGGGKLQVLIHATKNELKDAEERRQRWLARFPRRSLCYSRKKVSIAQEQPACSTFQQFGVLLERATRCSFRDLHMAKLRLAAHLMVGLALGLVFYQIGNDASRVAGNVGCVFFLMMFIFFSNSMPSVHTFPSEMAVMLREHLNGWYALRSYYAARTLADLPLQILCPSAFLTVAYFMTGQPPEWRPFLQLWLVALFLTLVAQSLGLLVGAASDVKMGIFLVPVVSVPMLLFSGYFVRIPDIPYYLRWLADLSVFRYAFEACLIALYGYDRSILQCPDDFCLYGSPAKFLKRMELDKPGRFTECIIALATFLVILQAGLYVALRCRISIYK